MGTTFFRTSDLAKELGVHVNTIRLYEASGFLAPIPRGTNGDLGMAMEFAYQYLAQVRVERTYAESALEFLERWAAGRTMDASPHPMHIRQAGPPS
ncbi:MerR family DNA-binding transcriptional regulator [Ktedonobacter robiniae]|uniref:HTH merR-type domain-containing protein n=1 Tax=Ktedonobacter robiniae TaxID=2778365 RepID=A0ABQ3UXV7_9CHLR|nr:MerR family DNA-binding transcriptional regulator [Ktedonobacter robiniae]GHO57498.1 hypothetical protein KSB_59730 [Ktedonobacter robiniae]